MWWLLVVLPAAIALNYRCQNDQVLVVQSFGNDTIRMHCQRLDMCGYQQLRCDYDESQPQCGGLMNFVAHVVQSSATSPVEHTCCNLFNPRAPHTIPTHIGNDCFIYELPDGSSHSKPPDSHDDTPYTVLKSAADIPEQIDGMSGYRLRLYLLKNKAPPTLLVKGIERRLDGYRVTICRPRCTSYEAVQREGSQEDPNEWKAISWSSWTTSTWSTWARSVWGNVGRGQNRQRIEEIHKSGSVPSNPASEEGLHRVHEEGPNRIHVHVNASGNNNNVITPGRSEPNHINITVHTGQYRGGADGFDGKPNGHDFEGTRIGSTDGEGGDNGGRGGGGSNRRGHKDGEGEDSGDVDGAKSTRKQHRHEKPDEDGNDRNGDSGEEGGRGGKRGKLGKGRKHGRGDGKSDEDGEDLGGEEGDNEGGDAGAGRLGKSSAKGKGTGKGKGKEGKDGSGRGGKGDGLDGTDDGDARNAGGPRDGGAGAGDSGARDGKDGLERSGKDGSSLGKNGGKGKSKGGDGLSDGNDGNGGDAGSGDGLAKGGAGKNAGDRDGSDGKGKPGDGSGDGNGGGDGGKGADGGSGGSKGDGKLRGTGDGNDGNGKLRGIGDGNDGNGKAGAGGDGGKAGKDGDKQGGAGNAGENEGGKAGGSGGKGKGAATDGKDGAAGKGGVEDGKPRHGPEDGKAGDGGSGGDGVDAVKGAGGKSGGKGGQGKNGADEDNGSSDGSDTGADGKNGKDGKGKVQNRQEVTDSSSAISGGGTTKRTIDNSVVSSTPGGADGHRTTDNGSAGSGTPGDVKWTDDGGLRTSDVFTTDEFVASSASAAGGTTARPVSKGAEAKANATAGGTLLASGPLAAKSGAKGSGAAPSDGNKKAGAARVAKTASAKGADGGAKGPAKGAITATSFAPAPKVQHRSSSTTPRTIARANAAPNQPAGGSPGGSSGEAQPSSGEAQAEPAGQGDASAAADPPARANLGAMGQLKKMNCFPADAVVTTVTGQKRMDQLAVGDFVLVPSAGDVLKYERVEMFYHREPETRAQFVVLFTASKKRLALTPLHLLPFGECQSMKRDLEKADGVEKWLRASQFAHKATVGECVLTVSNNGEVIAERIVKIGRQLSEGIYSPMTVDGALIVNGVLSSCFSQVESHTVQKVVYDFLTYAYEFFGLSPGRNAIQQGIPSFINYVHELSHVFLPFSKF